MSLNTMAVGYATGTGEFQVITKGHAFYMELDNGRVVYGAPVFRRERWLGYNVNYALKQLAAKFGPYELRQIIR